MFMSKINRELVLQKYGGKCGYCGCDITLKTMQVDHIIPQVFNGTDDYDNLMLSCRSCNHYKRADTLDWFRHKMKTIHARLSHIYIFKVAEKYGIVTIKPFDGKFYFERATYE